MILQKYDFGFFYDNYKYRYITMYENYNEKLKGTYRFWIKLNKDMNSHSRDSYEIYRSNLSVEEIIKKLDDMEFMIVDIVDMSSSFPEISQYTYTKIEDCKQVIKIYKDKQSETRKLMDDTLIYSYWADYKNKVMSARYDKDHIQIGYDGYYMTYYYEKDDITVFKTIPLSEGIKMKYDTEHRYMVEKVLRRQIKANKDGFYEEMIEEIKNKFGIKEIY